MKKIILNILCLIFIASIFLTVNGVNADTVWCDDFDDEETDGWETEILDWDLYDPFTGEAVDFDTSAGTLKAPGDTPGNIWYLATHESTQDYGTWSFDVNIVDTPWEHFYVFLMTDDWADYPYKAYSYDIVISTEHGSPDPENMGEIHLFKRNGWSAQWDSIGEWYATEELVGKHDIIVTRDPDGVFDVYLNDELIMHVEDSEPEFGMFSTFRFEAPSGPSIDNVVVLDTYDIETARAYEPEPEFEMSNLVVEPDSVNKGKSVSVSVECSNVGCGSGSHTVVLKIDGEDEDEKTVSLDANDSSEIIFQAPTSQPGKYTVEIDGLTGSYEVKGGIPGFPVESLTIGMAFVIVVLWLYKRSN